MENPALAANTKPLLQACQGKSAKPLLYIAKALKRLQNLEGFWGEGNHSGQ
jgi:hypothetical protein